jgi:alpha-D-ribose 1-methylphosphonate 5-triphosphate synthase subunit PhnL
MNSTHQDHKDNVDQTNEAVLKLNGVSKSFFLHQRSNQPIEVLQNVNLEVSRGECVALEGTSGMGKSSILKMIYGNYKVSAGQVLVKANHDTWVNVSMGRAREILQLRKACVNYVSQFLRVIPRVGAFELIKQEAMFHSHERQSNAQFEKTSLHSPLGLSDARALDERVAHLLEKLNIPSRLWHLPPATFSGGEQQRINLAKSLINPKPILLLDEPSASLDQANTDIVIELINEARQHGTAILGIFHDTDVKKALTTRTISMHDFQPKT